MKTVFTNKQGTKKVEITKIGTKYHLIRFIIQPLIKDFVLFGGQSEPVFHEFTSKKQAEKFGKNYINS